MDRRTFIGWLSGAIVAAATPEVFESFVLVPGMTPRPKRMSDITIHAHETGTFRIERAWRGVPAVLVIRIGAGGFGRWSAAPGDELYFRHGDPLCSIVGPRCDWSMIWTDVDDREMCTYCQDGGDTVTTQHDRSV